MNIGMGWAAFWPALAKIAMVSAALWIGLEAIDLIRDLNTPTCEAPK